MPRVILGKILKRKKLSKRQFAKRIGMHDRHVFALFHDDYNPTFKMLCRWAKAIPCKVKDLIEE
jgi:transcriptional regulator with XRE-family HTH domain